MCVYLVVIGSERDVAAPRRARSGDRDFAPNRSDEPLDEALLPRRARYGRMNHDPHCTNAAYISRTECAVVIAKQMTRRFVPTGKSQSRAAIHWVVGLAVTLILTSAATSFECLLT